MKINDATRIAQLMSYQKTNRQAGEKKSDATRTARDGVSISQEALNMARELQGEDGAERTERIASVKQAIQNGTYQVEPDAVARKLMQAYGIE